MHCYLTVLSDVQSDAVPAGLHDRVGANERLGPGPNAGNVLARAEALARHKVRIKCLEIAVEAADLAGRHEGVHLHGSIEAVPQVPLVAGNGDRRDGRAGGGDGACAAEGREPDHELIVAGAVAVAAGAAGREEVVGDVGDDAGASVAVSVSGPAPQKPK